MTASTNPGSKAASVTLEDPASGKSTTFPVLEGTLGPKVIDIR
ncbi:MAG: hypothetical protein JWM77_1618, partial [Rhodospirillales bacterium]|nr:hypothetical protein [Rhodospirillales bacterium]